MTCASASVDDTTVRDRAPGASVDNALTGDQSPSMFKRWRRVFLLAMTIGSVLGFLIAAVVTYVTPRQYESQAVIEVKPRVRMLGGECGEKGLFTPRFFATEIEKIKSRVVFERVVDVLELVNRWNVDKESAVRKLKQTVNTEHIRGTNLISISVRHTNKVDARDIAMEVVDSYKGYRLDNEEHNDALEFQELERAIKAQEGKVEERCKVLATIPVPPKENPDMLERPRGLGSRIDYEDVKKDYETDLALLQMIKLKQAELKIASKMPRDSVVIHQPPVIADSYASPNVMLNLVCGTVGGFLISLLLAEPLMFVLNRMIPESSESRTSGP